MNAPQTVYIGLGSNKGKRLEFLQKAIDEIQIRVGDVLEVSQVYETPAWGFKGNAFLNACIRVSSRFSSAKILKVLLHIEEGLGRERKTAAGYQDRTIDLDLLLFGDEIQRTPDLIVPHPEIENRRFVLLPLSNIAGKVTHPIHKSSIADLLANTSDNSSIHSISEHLRLPDRPEFSNLNYIAVEGNIGAGKTSFATMVSQDFNARLILERYKDNAFLPKFYEDQQRYAFSLEMSFLADRYQQLSEDLAQYDLFKEFVISDYDVFKSLIFAKITLQDDEYQVYKKLFHLMYKELVKPDLYVYLYQNTDRLLENIRKRGREYEQNIQQEYLANINKSYLSFIRSQPGMNVKIVDISELDFVNRREDYLSLLGEIRNHQ